MGRRSILSLSGFDWITRFVCVKPPVRTNLAGDRQTITLWPVEVYSRGDGSRLPFRRIWPSTQSNFSPCSQPQHFRTVQGIFSRELGEVLSYSGWSPPAISAFFPLRPSA